MPALHVACAADGGYLPHCAAMLHSVLAHHPDTHVHFLHSMDIDDGDLDKLAGMVAGQGGTFVPHRIPDDWIDGLPRMHAIPPLMWYRVYLPQLLPDISRVLYLDADTLAVDALDDLWNMPLGSDYLAAVNNVLPQHARHWPRQLGLETEADYFNSGVLLLNLDAMRADAMSARLVAFGRDPDRPLRWPDQDALNLLLGNRRRVLHPRWNCQNSLYYWPDSEQMFPAGQVAQAVQNPAILHFEGPHLGKPWHYLNHHPLRKLYFQHRSQTPWPQVDLEDRRLVYMPLRHLPTAWTVAILSVVMKLRNKVRGLLL